MASGSVFSETLQSITAAKLSELSNKRTTFEARHQETLTKLNGHTDSLARVIALFDGVKHCFNVDTNHSGGSSGTQDRNVRDDFVRLDRFLEQAKFDPSISSRILKEWEDLLLHHLDVQLRRYKYATLYGQLVTEWLSSGREKNASAGTGAASTSTDVEMGESFDELPGKKRLEAREHFEEFVFKPANVDKGAIEQYLSTLFGDEPASETRVVTKALTSLQESTAKFQLQLSSVSQFNSYTVARSVSGLLKTDLFTGEKRTVLKNFQNSTIILSEIADVLNMRMSALSSWSWGSGGVPIEQRRKLNGKFDIYMHEDLLQAIFLQYIGVEWSVFFKRAFKKFRPAAWKSNFRAIPRVEKKRREYYLGLQETDEALQRKRRRTYRRGYFVYHLLDSAGQEIEVKEGEEEAEFEGADEDDAMLFEVSEESVAAPRAQLASMAARKSAPSTGDMRHRRIRDAKEDDEESDDGADDEGATKKPMERKQDLLHLLSTEAAVNTRIHGSFAAFRSVFDELQNALPHEAVMAIMSFFGVSEKWLDFFRTYLEAPLRFLEDEDDVEPRNRKRGAPASHALSDVFRETMLFCLDFSINRRTNGTFLYRLSDDFWFWSHEHEKAYTAWTEIRRFADLMALPLNQDKSGSISIASGVVQKPDHSSTLPTGRIKWGMMFIDPQSLRFKIDQKMVDDHVAELRKQLDAKSSVFDWIQVWNAYANTFFASNFGKAANCFGQQHVDDILATHQRIQKTLFAGQSVVQHLKGTIEQRFDVKDLAEGFLFFPVELGGLELQSPFVSPLQLRENVTEHPSKILDEFETNEKEEYHELKTRFDKGTEPDTRDEVDDPSWKPSSGADEFMSFEEYTKYREEFTTAYSDNHLTTAYEELLKRPSERSIDCSPVVQQALEGLRSQSNTKGITASWSGMDAYWRWIAQMYGPEMIERFGGLSVVESGLLPIGMVGLFRDQKVKWQG